MTDSHRDFSCSTASSIDPIDIPIKNIDFESSSLDSYSNFFDKAQHDFTTSSEISFINLDNEPLDKNPLSTVDHNQTFTKEISKTIINVFTGKEIGSNPWRKLCTKNIQQEKPIDDMIPIEVFSPNPERNQDKIIPGGQFSNPIVTRQSRRDVIHNQRAIDNTYDRSFEQFLQEHQNTREIKHQEKTTPRRRRKRNSLKDCVDDSSTSSDERPIDIPPKINPSINNDSLWHRLADVYTSEESDDSSSLLRSNISYTIRLKSETDTPDSSFSSNSSSTHTHTRSIVTEDSPKPYFNFLESLSERVAIEDKHLDAKLYFLPSHFNLKEQRQPLAEKLLSIFDKDVFSSQLSDKVSVVWSGRLTATAGHCTTRRNTRTAVITLSHKVCDSPERCRDTLLHEMCHAAVTLIDGIMEHGHGPLWRKWTRIAEESYPYLPSVSVRHTYDVIYKFTYRCSHCQYEVYRHSRSLNLAVDFCGRCMGKFELIINNNNADNQERKTPKKKMNKYNQYVKENFHVIKQANPHLSTPQLMKQLSEQYKKKNQQQEHTDLPNLEQLKI